MIYIGHRLTQSCSNCGCKGKTMEISVGDIEFNVCIDCADDLLIMLKDTFEEGNNGHL